MNFLLFNLMMLPVSILLGIITGRHIFLSRLAKKLDVVPEPVLCPECGFDLMAERDPVIMDDNILSMSEYYENCCKYCGHQKDGSTIKGEDKK
jgi:hypothetical protein